MDRTEVTQAQYVEFLKAKGTGVAGYPAGDTSGQPEVCKYNVKWIPDSVVDNAYCEGSIVAYDPAGEHADYPVACVDWCDAYGYCAWAGKRLCGRIGGGSADLEGFQDAAKSEWYFACSQGGKTAYSYGEEFDPARCAVKTDAASSAPPNAPVESSRACSGSEAPFDSILDLSGNVGEWEDACDAIGDSRLCLLRGAAYDKEMARCDWSNKQDPLEKSPEDGIRCCADPK